MKAFGATKHLKISEAESIFEFETAKPQPTGHDILVRVLAISVNPVDVYDRGKKVRKDDLPKVTGWDAYGIVESIGNLVSLFRPGDKVFYAGAYDRPGCDSEFHLVDERIVGNAPSTLSPAEIAAMPLTTLTAWEALFEQMSLNFDEKEQNGKQIILIINGAGGVGSVATQLAKRAGLTVISTASRSETIQWTKQHGADYVVNHRHDLIKQVHALGFQYVDYILELNNLAKHWHEIGELIRPAGTVVSITGSSEPVNLFNLKAKRVKFAWEWMYSKSFYQTDDMISQHEILTKIATLLDNGELVSTLKTTLKPISAANLRQAHKIVESKHEIGKVVIEGWK